MTLFSVLHTRLRGCCYHFSMALGLSENEARVLGALVEKESTTPEYYPLSLNALINACNQKSNRDPVMTLDEESVRVSLRSLADRAMARSGSGDSRVAKFEHRLNELYNFHRHELAILCVLLLRGPQTPGELRTRAERMYAFEDLDAVHAALNLLMRREPPLAKVLPRQPGTKESRYMHLFTADTVPETEGNSADELSNTLRIPGSPNNSGSLDRILELEGEVSQLRREVETLREQFAAFQKQFQ
ncbi:MAG TPA: YceH family protein [Candidatus Acidoferrum sp.]|nr:YceH family protein [Candidatus Acidoferrum sp.]